MLPKQPVTLSIEQALQQAVGHQQAGRLRDAEQLYRAILQIAPNHPDANHNLGVLAMRLNQPGSGLAYLKLALEANPSQTQYWLSYIEALIRCGQHDVAAQVLPQARQRGVQGAAVELLAARMHGEKTVNTNPTHLHELNAFRELCNQNRYTEAEALARGMTERFPVIGDGWKALGAAINLQGRKTDALPPLQQAAKLLPGDAGAHLMLGSVLHDVGHAKEAEFAYRHAILIDPNSVEAHNNLGLLLRRLGRFEEAESEYRHAVRLEPNCAVAHYNLGSLLYDRKRYEESASAYRQTLLVKPDYAEAHYDLGNVLMGLDRMGEAIQSFRRAIDVKQHSAERHDDMVAARIGVENALARTVPLWHASMMNDDARNAAYLDALRRVVTSKTRVFEIGTGSGLLAMMAARCGAQHVATCETVPMIATTAREIIGDNGLASSIQVINRQSNEIAVGVELSQPADLLISEIVSNDLLAEGILPSMEDAKRRLLKPGSCIIPASASIVFALFEGEHLRQNIAVADVCGFKMGRFNSILQQRSTLLRQDLDVALLTDDVEAFCFDFAANSHFPAESKMVRVPIKAAGVCHGIIQWIRLRLDQANSYENHPCRKTPATSWGAVVYRLPAPIHVASGQTATVRASHDRRNSYLVFEGIDQGQNGN